MANLAALKIRQLRNFPASSEISQYCHMISPDFFLQIWLIIKVKKTEMSLWCNISAVVAPESQKSRILPFFALKMAIFYFKGPKSRKYAP